MFNPSNPVSAFPGDTIAGPNGWASTVKATINVSSAGNNTVIAASPGKTIRVLQYVLVASNAVTVTWESSGGSIIGGPMSFAANGGAAPPFCPGGHFDTVSGEGLVINLGGAVQVGGHLLYILY